MPRFGVYEFYSFVEKILFREIGFFRFAFSLACLAIYLIQQIFVWTSFSLDICCKYQS